MCPPMKAASEGQKSRLFVTSLTINISNSVPATPSLVPVPSQYIRVLAFVRFKCTLSAFEDTSALTLSRDDRGERGCLVEDTQRVFEPRERTYRDVRAGDGDRDVLPQGVRVVAPDGCSTQAAVTVN
jgi:hypothetical protein